MEFESFYIEIEGEEVSDIYPDLVSLEVELDDQLAGMFRIRLPLKQQDDTWTYLDDEQFRVWKKVSIGAGFDGDTEELIVGRITHVKPIFDPDLTRCYLDIWGMDESVLMDREEKLKDWPNKKDSDIAKEVFGLYGFSTSNVEDTVVVHEEAVSTIIQRETDMQFVKRLALRNGFECYIEGKAAYFGKPRLDDTPQPVLACHFGKDTNLTRFSIEVNSLTPANVAMFQLDRLEKTVVNSAVEASQQTTLGKTDAGGFLGTGVPTPKTYVAMNVVTGKSEMDVLCQGFFHEAEWFVSGEGEIAGNLYGHALKARSTVTIKGVGETYSGVYYVAHVTHSFTPDGYVQYFKVKRNALMPTGGENF